MSKFVVVLLEFRKLECWEWVVCWQPNSADSIFQLAKLFAHETLSREPGIFVSEMHMLVPFSFWQMSDCHYLIPTQTVLSSNNTPATLSLITNYIDISGTLLFTASL